MKFMRAIASWVRGLFARYEGATFSPTRSSIPASLNTGRYDITKHSREEIARKVIYFDHNNPLLQALSGKFENFVVGANPQLSPNSSDPDWNAAAKADWDAWAPLCDIASRQGFATLMGLVARTWFQQGDCFIILTQGEMRNGRAFPRIQLVEGIQCKTPPELAKDPNVIDGVRLDPNGRPVEYYFAHETAPGRWAWDAPRHADGVIHVFEPSRPCQVRGISFFHSVINELHDLDDLHLLEMQAARENASTREYIETANGEIPEHLKGTTGRFATVTQSVPTAAGGTATEIKQEYYRTISGGVARVLMTGDKVHQNAGTRPSVTTTEYWKLKRELVCMGVEIPYIIVFPDQMQGTVYRGSLDMATAYFKSRHAVLAEVMRRIWEYVMRYRIATEKALVNAPKDWRNVSVLPPRAPNVDVGRNDAAESQALKDGRTNYDLIYGPRGLDWRTELKKLNDELEFIEAECPALDRHLAAESGMGEVPITLRTGRRPTVVTE